MLKCGCREGWCFYSQCVGVLTSACVPVRNHCQLANHFSEWKSGESTAVSAEHPCKGRGQRKRKQKAGRKKKSLHCESVSGNASWPKLAGSCPSKWQQLLAVRESMSQSEEKSDGIYINTTLMAHLALRRVPGCATDS